MNRSGDRDRKPAQPKGILKNSGGYHASLALANGSSAFDKMRNLVEQLVPKEEPRSVRSRITPVRAASTPRSPPERELNYTEAACRADLDEGADHEVDDEIFQPVAKICKCQACWKPLGEFEGYILRNCQNHIVCKSCLFHKVEDDYVKRKLPTCPVENCRAVMKQFEIDSICSEDQTETTRDSEGSQKDDKRPTSSDFDESEEITPPPPEEILIPRGNETTIVARRTECDKCKKVVRSTEYMDIRNCKLKHRICFECIRAAVRISKTLVRCPLYRVCKSMMTRDEVLLVRYDIRDTEERQKSSSSSSRAKAKKYIYPNGLPSRDLWPVLDSTKCSKCYRDIDVLNGIVIQQCNIHCVCVSCVREMIAKDRKLVECPMYRSCKSMMMDDEVRAFIERFGGPKK